MLRTLIRGLIWLLLGFLAFIALSVVIGIAAGKDGCLRLGTSASSINIGICQTMDKP